MKILTFYHKDSSCLKDEGYMHIFNYTLDVTISLIRQAGARANSLHFGQGYFI